ncbi:hypothetical protein ABVT39_000100 [Epinephelus coioides]
MERPTPKELRNNRGARNSREVAEPVPVLPQATRCKVDPEHMLGIAGIVGTVLNLLVVVFVYLYTPV